MIGSCHTLDRLLDRASRLYSLPAVAVRVLQLTANPDLDTVALKQCVERDPALTSKILRVVNSSLFGLSGEVSDLQHAITLLGIKPLKLLVLGFSLPENLLRGVAAESLGRYWRRTLTKAVAARLLSRNVQTLTDDDAFMAGLLDHLGMLVLIQELGEPYVKFLSTAFRDGDDLEGMETRVLGFSHRQLSTTLLAQWHLPRPLIAAMDLSRSPESFRELSPEERHLPQVLHLADLLSRLLVDGRARVLPELLETAGRYHGLSAGELSSLVGELQTSVADLAEVLSLELPGGVDYRDVLVQAHEQLAIVAADVAGGGTASSSLPRTPGKMEEACLLDEARSLSAALRDFMEVEPPATEAMTPRSSPPLPATAIDRSRATESLKSQRLAIQPATDPGLLGQLTAALATCRQLRCPLSLLLVEIDGLEILMIRQGPAGAEALVRLVDAACRAVEHPWPACIQLREARFAILLTDCDRRTAAQLGNQLVRFVRHLEGATDQGRPNVTVSVGAATVSLPSKNFCPQQMIDSADRCLFGVQFSGGNGLKSIEV